jgi:capsular exopolysaccharide synthesis family protein
MISEVNPSEQIDLGRMWKSIQRYVPFVIAISLAVGSATYLYSSNQPKVYQATATVMATNSEIRNNSLGNSLVGAPALPDGAVNEAVHGSILVASIIERLKKSDLPKKEINVLARVLKDELSYDAFSTIKVVSKIDTYYLMGTYSLSAVAGTPEAARELANATATVLLDWDVGRATQRVKKARVSLEKQIKALDVRIAEVPRESLDRETLIKARSEVIQQVAQAGVLEQSVSGTLTLVSEAATPILAVAPQPRRNALLTTVLMFLLLMGAAIVRSTVGRKVSGDEDIMDFGLSVMGSLPKLNTKQLELGMPLAVKSGALYESVGFLRVNLVSSVNAHAHRRYVVSSSRPGEGKSSVTASLAMSLASSGLKVLVIDADMHRPTQHVVWNVLPTSKRPLRPMVGAINQANPAIDLPSALERPEAAHALNVAEGVDLLPAGKARRDTSAIINHPQMEYLLDRWSSDYDFILIDTPPMLALADTLSLAKYTSGILMVTEADQTPLATLERSLANARLAQVEVVGVVINKISRRSQGYYYYYNYNNYNYRPSIDGSSKEKSSESKTSKTS